VFSILLGDAVPQELVGTTDNNFYNHYSEITTVEANWDLHTLGRWDVGANVYSFVAAKTGDRVRTSENPPLAQTYLNLSYPGVFNNKQYAPLPVPNVNLCQNGRTVLPAIKETWGCLQDKSCYHGQLEIPTGANPPACPAY
jgi:acid phosphatase